MIISKLISALEDFRDEFGDLEVAVNRNGREYPVFIRTTGTFPATTRQPNEYSGYFEYIDDDEYTSVELDDMKVPCPECDETMDYFWRRGGFVCPHCGLEVDEGTVRSEFLDEKKPNLCILND